jgi:hypothetical protein
MWVWEFVGGLLVGWIAISLLLSKDFWLFLFHLFFGGRTRTYHRTKVEEEPQEEVAPTPKSQSSKSTENDLSKLPREELAELLRTSEVRVKK